jgi:hypothetical protein
MKIVSILIFSLFLLVSCSKSTPSEEAKKWESKKFSDKVEIVSPKPKEEEIQDFQIRWTLAEESRKTGIDKNLLGQKDTVYYIVWPHGDDMSGDISRYLEAKKIVNPISDMYYEDRILTALNTLFSIKTERIDDTHTNSLSQSDLKTEKVELIDGVMHIYLKWKITWSGVALDAFIKPQIHETIQAYSTNYKVYLNGSEKEWKCALDMSWECK